MRWGVIISLLSSGGCKGEVLFLARPYEPKAAESLPTKQPGRGLIVQLEARKIQTCYMGLRNSNNLLFVSTPYVSPLQHLSIRSMVLIDAEALCIAGVPRNFLGLLQMVFGSCFRASGSRQTVVPQTTFML